MIYEIAMLRSEISDSWLEKLDYECLQELCPELLQVDTYENIDSFCEALESGRSYQAVLLEAEQQQREDYAAATRIRAISSVCIIFLAAKDELAYEIIQYQPFQYVRESCLKPDLQKAMQALKPERTESLIAATQAETLQAEEVAANRLLCVEVYGHWLEFHMTDGTSVRIKGVLRDYVERLEQQGFVQIHKSYLVNMEYISVIEKDSVILTDERRLPLSRHRKKEVKERYRQYRRG